MKKLLCLTGQRVEKRSDVDLNEWTHHTFHHCSQTRVEKHKIACPGFGKQIVSSQCQATRRADSRHWSDGHFAVESFANGADLCSGQKVRDDRVALVQYLAHPRKYIERWMRAVLQYVALCHLAMASWTARDVIRMWWMR